MKRLPFYPGVLALCALGVLAATACSSSVGDETEEGNAAVVVERTRIDELVRHAEEATVKADELKLVSIEFAGIRDPASSLPVFAKASGITADLDPLLRKLEERITQVPPDALRRAGFLDVPDAEYQMVIAVVRSLRGSLQTTLPRAAEDMTRAPSGPNLSELDRERLRMAVRAYSELIASVARNLSTVAAQLKDWLRRSSGPEGGGGGGGAETIRSLPLLVRGACAENSPQPTTAARTNWATQCTRTKEQLSIAFRDTLDGIECGDGAEAGGAAGYCFRSDMK